jgi:hypothetical protein
MQEQFAESSASSTMTNLVIEVADCPCASHQEAFVRGIAHTQELIFQVSSSNVEPSPGVLQSQKGDEIRLVDVIAAEGRKFLLAFPDLDAARRHDASATFVGIGLDAAIGMVLGSDLDGILVDAVTANLAWAAATRNDLADLSAP